MKTQFQNLTKALVFCVAFALLSCDDSNDPVLLCELQSVVNFNRAPTEFSLQKLEDGKSGFNRITVYKGTDSVYTYTYTYNGAKLTSITHTEKANSRTYELVYDGSVVSKFTIAGQEDIRLVYSSGKLTEAKSYLGANGSFYQIGAQKYTYDGVNLTKSELQVDLISLLTIAFGGTPTAYTPSTFEVTTYEPSTYDNPLKGFLFIDNPGLSAMEKMPLKVTVKDGSGKTVSTDTYTFTKGTNDLATKATASSTKYSEMVYECH